ncbi:MAG: NACHT domain-containing protein [Ktedonobacteraceae bacterium]|nr:NACHT domain-containing protein [Ktedonobacteraceae bacterium]
MPGKTKSPNQRLKQERERRFWTIEDVAIRISNLPEFTPGEPDPRTVRRWEQGISFPSPRYCRALCTIFELDAQALGLVPSATEQQNTLSPPSEAQHAPIDQQQAEQEPPVLHSSTQDATNGLVIVSLNSSATLQPPSLAHPSALVDEQASPVKTEQERAQPGLSRMSQQNRRRMLRKVYDFWISGVLEQSLHGAALLALGLHEQRDAVANPWHLVLHQPEQAATPLPPGTSISHVYDTVDGELLILGEPGSGKTTLLLELARTLLERATEDEAHPLPVVFNLSSWAQKQRSLSDWMVEELHSKYQVPRELAQSWVQSEQILPLLDGLDEVTASVRSDCIETINTYRQQHGLLSLVVCCRQTEYFAQSTRLLLRRAVVVQPLSAEQIETYLTSGGEQFATVLAAFRADTGLRELVTTPLWLNVLVLASQGQPFDHLLVGDSVQAKQQQVFATYVQRMLERRGYEQPSMLAHMQGWLTRLAKQMRRQDQTIFYLEHMQPSALESEHEQRLYERFAVALPAILIGVLVSLIVNAFLLSYNDIVDFISFALFGGVIAGVLHAHNASHQNPLSEQRTGPHFWQRFGSTLAIATLVGLACGLSYGLRVGPTYGLAAWLHDGLWSGGSLAVGSLVLLLFVSEGNVLHPAPKDASTPRSGLRYHLFNSITIRNVLLIGFVLGISAIFPWNWPSVPYGLSVAWYNMMCLSTISVLLIVILDAQSNTITPAEIMTWSWRRFSACLTNRKHLQQAVIIALLSGLGTGISDVFLSGGKLSVLRFGVSVGLSLGFSYWLLVALFQAIKNENLEDHHRVVPNQGIRRSIRNALLISLISSAIGFMMSLLEDTQTGVLAGTPVVFGLHMLGRALVIGLAGGLLVGILNGGLACWRHAVLRFLLWRMRAFPYKAVAFLNSATECLLLHKVGGGFIFIHRLLLEYLASLPAANKDL